MALAIFASLMMSVSTRLRVGCIRNLAPKQARHHFDAGQRVLYLVRDDGRHFTDRSQPVAQPLTLLELLDARQVLEEHRRADRRSPSSSRTSASV